MAVNHFGSNPKSKAVCWCLEAQTCTVVLVGDASKKHISNVFGLVLLLMWSAEPANEGLDQHVPDGFCAAPFRAALFSVCEPCQRDLRLALTRFGLVDRLGRQQGDQLVCLRCQQHLTLPAQFVTTPNSVVTNTWEKPANSPQSANMFVVRDVSCFSISLSLSACLPKSLHVCLLVCHSVFLPVGIFPPLQLLLFPVSVFHAVITSPSSSPHTSL